MNESDRWRQIERVCQEALAREPDERDAFVAGACGTDEALHREVASLLAQQSQAGRFLEPPEARGEALAAGTRLGAYEITAFIGAGGMGEIYKARDTRLGRTVAIKILPPGLAFHEARRRLLEDEARAVSALNHPHICTLHDIGSTQVTDRTGVVKVDYLVMEYIDGQTLAERLRQGALPLAQALEYAAQIADGLDQAHRLGIVHRDLKPANVMLTKTGVKLLDFGLARLRAAPAVRATAQPPAVATEVPSPLPGFVVGTVPYMAPEQLAGEETDARTDLFAFGCVLHEMLTGRRAFPGDTEAAIVSAIMSSRPPPVSSLRPSTPPLLDHIVRTCLDKEPDERWQSAADIARGLRWIVEEQREGRTAPGQAPEGAGVPVSRPGRVARVVTLAALAALLVAAAVAVTWLVTRGPASPPMPVRALIDTRPADGLRGAGRAERTMGLNRPSRTAIALSPDGAWLVFSGVQGERQQLYRRRLSDDAAVPLAGTEGAESPFFSPDGRWVGFWSGGALWKVRLDGGVPTQLCPAPEVAGASWSSRDVIAFSSTKLYLVPASGGASTVLLAPDPARQESALRFPHFLPDGRTLLLTIVRDQIDLRTASIVAASLQGRARTALVEGAMDARYVPTGHLVYPRLGSLEAAPFDAARVATTGPQVGLLADLMQSANTSSTGFDMGAGQFSVSASGTLVFLAGGIVPDRRSSLVWVDRRGSTVATLPLPPGPYVQPRLSPDGRKILYKTAGVTGALWSYDRAARTATIIPTGRGSAFFPIWTPDGQRAVFGAPGGGFSRLWSVPVDGRAAAMRYEGNVPPTAGEFPGSWTPDGGTLIYTRIDEDGTHTIWQLRTDGGLPTRTELLPPPGWRAPRRPILYTLPALSPDGRWLAYASTESGTFQVYVERFPELGDRQQPWRESGQSYAPLWRRDGRELFFVEEGSSAELPRTMMAVDVRPDGRLAAEPRALFPLSPDLLTAFGTLAPYDVSPDGRQFIFVRRESPSFPPPPSQMHVVFNWFEELQAKVPRR